MRGGGRAYFYGRELAAKLWFLLTRCASRPSRALFTILRSVMWEYNYELRPAELAMDVEKKQKKIHGVNVHGTPTKSHLMVLCFS